MYQFVKLRYECLRVPNQTRADAGAEAAATAADVAAPLRKDNNPILAGSCSSKKRSSGALNAPCKHTIPNPIIRAVVNRDPTLVKNTTTIVKITKTASVSRSENVRPRTTSG